MIVRPSGAFACSVIDHGCGVGGVGHQEHFVVGHVVGDEIVDHAARIVAAQRVLGLAGSDAAEVVGQRGVDVFAAAPGPAHQCLAEMTDVEEADGVAGRVVLADRARVGHRHEPAPEFGEAGTQFAVAVLQRALQQVVTHAATTLMPDY